MSKLTTNTTDLQAILDKVNELPESDSVAGGSLETCTVTFKTTDPFRSTDTCIVIYVGADGQAQQEQWIPNETVITVAKGSHIVVVNWNVYSEASGTVLMYSYGSVVWVYRVTSDSILTYYM